MRYLSLGHLAPLGIGLGILATSWAPQAVAQATAGGVDSAAVRQRILASITDTSRAVHADRWGLIYHAIDLDIDLPSLVEPFLHHESPEVRARAVEFLELELIAEVRADRADSAVALLEFALRDSSPEVRRAAIWQLTSGGAIAAPAAPALQAALADPDAHVRREAVYALGQMGSAASPAIPHIIELTTDDPAFEVRWLATRALGWLGSLAKDAVPVLLSLSATPDDTVRLEAVRSLGSIVRPEPCGPGDPQVEAVLAEALGDANADIREAAVEGLVCLGATGLRLAASALADPDTSTAMMTARLLGQAEPLPSTVRALVRALGDPRVEVRRQSADALGSLGETTRADLRVAAASPDSLVREAAQRGLRFLDVVRSSPVAGRCYAFKRGAWSPDLGLGRDSVFSQAPENVRFLTTQAMYGWWARESVSLTAVPTNGSPFTVHGPGSWTPTDDGQDVEVVWSTGFSGLTMHLHVRDAGESLDGEARTFWDFPREIQKAAVTAQHVPCESSIGRE